MPRKGATSASQPKSPTQANGDTSMVSNATETKASPKASRHSTSKNDADPLGIDDLLLPRSLTTRLARGVLPANTSIQKDATLALTKSATVFISYLASHANELTTKKTIGPQDVLNALKEIELGQVMGLGQIGKDGRSGGRLEREMEMYEDAVRGKRKGYREKVKARESGVSHLNDEEEQEDEGGEPQSKRARRMSEVEDKEGEEDLLDAQLNGPVGSEEGVVEAASPGQRQTKTEEDADDTEDDPEVEGEGEGEAEVEDEDEDDDEEEQEEEEEEQEREDDGEEEEEREDDDDDEEDSGSVDVGRDRIPSVDSTGGPRWPRWHNSYPSTAHEIDDISELERSD